MRLNGIDVSYTQGKIDWGKVNKSGKVDFALMRAGFGVYDPKQIDVQFEANYKGCKDNSIPCGCYWYSYATSVEGAIEEAKACLKVITGKSFEYPIYFDLEEQRQFALGKTTCTAIARAFLETVEKEGYYVGLYISASPLSTHIEDSLKSRFAVWVADYRVSTNENTYANKYGVWQSSGEGAFSGISGVVDTDICYVDYPTAIKSKGLNGFKKTSSSTTNKPQEVKPISKPQESTTSKSVFKKGDKVTLNSDSLYVSASATSASCKKSGTFYIYSGEKVSGRYAITNSESNVGKTPVGNYVTGWVNEKDISNTSTTTEKNYVEYTIKSGDTLWDIAQKYLKNGSRYPEIKNMNGMTSDTIYAGTKIKIPKY